MTRAPGRRRVRLAARLPPARRPRRWRSMSTIELRAGSCPPRRSGRRRGSRPRAGPARVGRGDQHALLQQRVRVRSVPATRPISCERSRRAVARRPAPRHRDRGDGVVRDRLVGLHGLGEREQLDLRRRPRSRRPRRSSRPARTRRAGQAPARASSSRPHALARVHRHCEYAAGSREGKDLPGARQVPADKVEPGPGPKLGRRAHGATPAPESHAARCCGARTARSSRASSC